MALDLRMKNGFQVIYFEIICEFGSYFIHMYIIINYRSSYPLTIIRVMALHLCKKNGFRAISFEIIGVLDSYFIHRYIIIKYRSGSI